MKQRWWKSIIWNKDDKQEKNRGRVIMLRRARSQNPINTGQKEPSSIPYMAKKREFRTTNTNRTQSPKNLENCKSNRDMELGVEATKWEA